MKQKLVYIVLLIACIYLPASSKECGKVFLPVATAKETPAEEVPAVTADEISLPASPFSRLLFNL